MVVLAALSSQTFPSDHVPSSSSQEISMSSSENLDDELPPSKFLPNSAKRKILLPDSASRPPLIIPKMPYSEDNNFQVSERTHLHHHFQEDQMPDTPVASSSSQIQQERSLFRHRHRQKEQEAEYQERYSQVESYGLELESVEDISSDEEDLDDESSLSPEPSSSGRSSSDGEIESPESDDSDVSIPGRIVLDTDEEEVFETPRERIRGEEIFELSITKLQTMNSERGSEASLRKSVLICNTMRHLQRELSYSSSSDSSPENSRKDLSHHREEESARSIRRNLAAEEILEVNFQEEEVVTRAEGVRDAADENVMDDQQEELTECMVTGNASSAAEWPSEHVYCTQPDMNLMLCQQRAPNGTWVWSVAHSEPPEDTGYVQLDSAAMEPCVPEAMDTSERDHNPLLAAQLSPQQSVFSTTWSECTRSWEILNNNNVQNLAAGNSANQHRETNAFGLGQSPYSPFTTQHQGEEFMSLFSMTPPPHVISNRPDNTGRTREEGLSVQS